MKKITLLKPENKSQNFKKTALFRLKFWININSKPSHSSEAFWNRSTDHRIICMVAVNAALNQIPIELSVSPNRRDVISYESIRRLCRCTDKTMRTIIQEGVDRGELSKLKNGRETYISGTKSLVEVFEGFEQSWIKLFKSKE